MLPDEGTPERHALESEAMQVALEMLEAEHNSLANALYRTYMHFRQKLIEDFGEEVRHEELLTDARQLEAYINDLWAGAIRESFSAAGG